MSHNVVTSILNLNMCSSTDMVFVYDVDLRSCSFINANDEF